MSGLQTASVTDAEIDLALDASTVAPIVLFAGGTTGLVLLAGTEAARGLAIRIGELAEAEGLSALAFTADLPVEPEVAAARASVYLEHLGVAQTVLVAFGEVAAAGLRAARAFAAVILVEPVLAPAEVSPLLEEVRIPKLVVVPGNDTSAQETAALLYRHAVGPMAVRHLPGNDLSDGGAPAMVAETAIAFAIGVCGAGRPG